MLTLFVRFLILTRSGLHKQDFDIQGQKIFSRQKIIYEKI